MVRNSITENNENIDIICVNRKKDRTDRGGMRPSLFHLSKRSEKCRRRKPETFYYVQKGKITIGRVPLRSILYLLYIKRGQNILKFDMSIGRGEARALFHVW